MRCQRSAKRQKHNTPSTAGNSMTGSERPSPEPLLKKEASPAVLGGGENSGNALEPSNALNCRVWGIPAVLSRGIPGNALRAFPGSFRIFSGISSGKSQPYSGCGLVKNTNLAKLRAIFFTIPACWQSGIGLQSAKTRAISRCDSCDKKTLRFMCPSCTRDTDGIAAKVLRCGIASEALAAKHATKLGKTLPPYRIGKHSNPQNSPKIYKNIRSSIFVGYFCPILLVGAFSRVFRKSRYSAPPPPPPSRVKFA